MPGGGLRVLDTDPHKSVEVPKSEPQPDFPFPDLTDVFDLIGKLHFLLLNYRTNIY